MDDVYRMLAQRDGRRFLDALAALPEFKPRPGVDIGLLRVTVTVVGDDTDLGHVDIDPVNVGDLAGITARRAEGLRAKHNRSATAPATVVPVGKTHLRLVGGDQ
jgi:hypothetical protein